MQAELIIVVAFTLLLTLPFIFRPFHMDDAGFLELARARQDNPLAVTLEDYTFFGQENETFVDTHPPLVSTYQAILIALTGSESEVVLHLGFLVFPLTAAVSMYFLSRRFTRHALLVTLMLIGSPGALVMSHGLMSDMPGLSMWLLSIALYIYGLERRSQALIVLCALALTCGVFISYQVLSVIPLLLVYAYFMRQLSLLSILPFILPLSAFVSYFFWHHSTNGIFPRLSYGVGEPLAWYSIIQKIVSVALALGGALIFTGVLMRVLLRRQWDLAVYATFLIPMWIAMLVQYLMGEYTFASMILAVLFMPVGILLLYQLYGDGWRLLRGTNGKQLADNVFLLLWVSGVIFYAVFLLPYSSIRYMLPMFPPIILLFVRLVDSHFAQSARIARNILLSAVILSSAVALLVAGADYELASTFQRFARTDGERLGGEAAVEGGSVWFVGEFGFRYYMEQEGFIELPEESLVATGDLIIQSPLTDPRAFWPKLAYRLKLVDTIAYGGNIPLRTINFGSKAGFYGHFWGLLPFSISTGSLEEFLVYRVMDEEWSKEVMGKAYKEMMQGLCEGGPGS